MLIFFRKHYGHLSFLLSLPIKAAVVGKAALTLMQVLWWRTVRTWDCWRGPDRSSPPISS